MNSSSIQSNRETIYFIISLIVSALIYVLAAVSIVGIAVVLIVFAFMLFINAMSLGSIRGNGVKLHEQQFPDVYASVTKLSKEMGLKRVPDVFIVQSEGSLNAFATWFFGRDMVVLYSEVFELAREQGTEELDFIIAHELAHVKRRHVWKNLLIVPAGFIPFLSQAYSRSCEYTCDRHAAFAIQNPAAAKRALTLLGIGKGTYKEVNEAAYREQIATESNGFVWLSEVLSSHPRLPKRVQAIDEFAGNDVRLYTPAHGKVVLGVSLLIAGVTAVYIASVALFAGGTLVYSQLLPDTSAITDDLYYDDEYALEGQTDLMIAANAGDLTGAQEALMNGDDLYAKDSEGTDALMYAVYSGDYETISFLIDAGADADTGDDYSTALHTALMYSEYEIVRLLLENGADPSREDPYGVSAIEYIGASSEEEFFEMIESNNY